MRCPVCDGETSSALPRCTRCNASLDEPAGSADTARDERWPPIPWRPESQQDGNTRPAENPAGPEPWSPEPPAGPEPWSPEPPAEQQPWQRTAPESWHQPPPGPGADPWQPAPAADPWPGADPWRPTPAGDPWQPSPAGDPWQPAPGADAWQQGPEEPANEQTTSLSPEPWAEPQMWQPPQPARRRGRALPYILAAAGGVVLVAVALGIVFWPGGDDEASQGDQVATGQSPNQQAGAETPAESGGPQAKDQATKVDGLLNDMAATRSELGGVVTGGCETAGLRRIRDDRQAQLEAARSLKVDGLEQGDQLKDALERALDASVRSNQTYLDNAPGCPPESSVAGVNDEASKAKDEVIQYWGPIAQQHGLRSRTASSI